MATLGNEQGGVDYIGIFDAKLVQRVPKGTEGATSRLLTKGKNEGKPVWEKHYTCVSGMITGGEVAVKDFGGKKVKEIQVKLDKNIVLQIPMSLLSNFAKPLPNVDTSLPVKISVYKNTRGKTGLSISQNGVNVEWAYNKENPNGLPQPTQDELGEWDFRDHDRFLTLKVQEFFASIIPSYSQKPDGYEEAAQDISPKCPPVDDVEDIPF